MCTWSNVKRKDPHEGLPGGQRHYPFLDRRARSSALSLHTFNHKDGEPGEREGGKETDRSRGRRTERQSELASGESVCPGRAMNLGLFTPPPNRAPQFPRPLTPGPLPAPALTPQLWREGFLSAARHLNASPFPHSMNPLKKQESALMSEEKLLLDNWRDSYRLVLTIGIFSLWSHCGIPAPYISPPDEMKPDHRGAAHFSRSTATEAPQAAVLAGGGGGLGDTPSASFRTINTCTPSVAFLS